MAETTGELGTLARQRERQKQLVLMVSRVWAWVFLTAMIVFFAVSVHVTSDGDVNFFTIRNSQNILVTITPILLLGLGQTFVIITAGIDLSVGYVMSFASVVSALVIRETFDAGIPLFFAVTAGLLAILTATAFVGFINGVIIAKLNIN